MKVSALMTTPPVTVNHHATAAEAAVRLPVLDSGRLVGVLAIDDLADSRPRRRSAP